MQASKKVKHANSSDFVDGFHCPRCNSQKNVLAAKPLSLALFTMILPFWVGILFDPPADKDKKYFTCTGCGLEWYEGFQEMRDIKAATKPDEKKGCLVIFFLAAAVTTYLIVKG